MSELGVRVRLCSSCSPHHSPAHGPPAHPGTARGHVRGCHMLWGTIPWVSPVSTVALVLGGRPEPRAGAGQGWLGPATRGGPCPPHRSSRTHVLRAHTRSQARFVLRVRGRRCPNRIMGTPVSLSWGEQVCSGLLLSLVLAGPPLRGPGVSPRRTQALGSGPTPWPI